MLRLRRTFGAELHKPPRYEGGAEASRIDWLRAGLRPHERGQRAFNRHGAKDLKASNTNGMKPDSVGNLIVERRDHRIVIVGIATEWQFRLIRTRRRQLDILDPFAEQDIE